MRVRAGFSSLVAWVMIIGVAVAIIIASIGWIMSVWAQQGEYHTLQVLPASKIISENSTLHLELKNSGTVAAKIYMVEVGGMERVTVSIVVHPGESVAVNIPLNKTYIPGNTYDVFIYTEEGSVLKYRYKVPVI